MKNTKTLTSSLTLEIIYDCGYDCFHNAILSLKEIQSIYTFVKNYTVNRKTEIGILSSKEGIKETEYSKREYGKTVDGLIYDELTNNNTVNICLSNSINAAIRSASKSYDNNKKDVDNGKRTRETYRTPQPIHIPHQNFKIYEENGNFYLRYQPYSMKHNVEIGLKSRDAIVFKIKSPGRKNEEIIRKCLSPDYPDFKFGGSTITSKGKGKREKWFFHLVCSYPVEQAKSDDKPLDKTKYLGVDLGVVNPICASIYGDKEKNALIISGEHMIGHVHKMKKRLKEMQKGVAYCGNGKIGHGTAKRFEAVTKLKDKIANYRDTENKKMARQVVDYAIKNGCGTIQMEDLSGVKSNKKGKFLSDWVYYNLQLAIEYAAQKVGIEIVKVNPRYTSQRCSKCGAIHKDNRKSQSGFICVECGFTANADFNASQNLGIPYVDKIIKETKPSIKQKKAG